MVGGVGLVLLGVGTAVGLALGAQAELTKAADAAALATAATGVPQWTLRVPYVLYTCRRRNGGNSRCVVTAGDAQVVRGSRGGLLAAARGAFGLEPGWAARAGCASVSGASVSELGSFRVCSQPAVVGGVLRFPPAAAVGAVATEWLQANTPPGGLVTAAQVLKVQAGPAGDVTVWVQGRPVLGLSGMRLQARATAWMGR